LDFPSQPEYSFSNFIVSDGSKIAFDAARQFCSDSSSFNTLYFFGSKNLGKTHLLLSIGNQSASMNKKVLYVHGADFVKKTDESSNGSSREFVSILSNIDLFLLDAVDCIEGKRASQERLYLIINSLIEKEKKIQLSKEEAEDFYKVHQTKPFYNDLCEYLSSGPITVMILKKENAIADNRKLMGATDPKKSEEGTIRKKYGISIDKNSVHGSDSLENAKIEIDFFFKN